MPEDQAMDRLSIYLTLMTGSVLTGGIVIIGFTLGYYTVWVVAIGVIVGFVLSWPISYFISRRIKQNDADWNPQAKPGDYGTIPKSDAPEV
jgi:hypothetical protein